MPPKPEGFPNTDAYMEACMADPDMQEEYPDADKRQDVCFAVWNDAQGEGKEDMFPCECLDCGHTFDSKEHCNEATCPECGAKNCRRADRPGPGQPSEGADAGGKTRTLTKGRRYRSAARLVDVKAGGKAGENGWLEGYAATWDVDTYNERIQMGAFAKTIQEQIPGLPLMTVHRAHGGGVEDIIGTVTEAREDDKGLWVHAEFEDSALAQETREYVVDGKLDKMSVGYELIHFEVDRREDKDEAILKELKLVDVIATMDPVNPATAITAAKEAIEAARTAAGREHLDAKQIGELAIELRQTADQLDTIAEPDSTAGKDAAAAAAHYASRARSRRVKLLKLRTGSIDHAETERTSGAG